MACQARATKPRGAHGEPPATVADTPSQPVLRLPRFLGGFPDEGGRLPRPMPACSRRGQRGYCRLGTNATSRARNAATSSAVSH